MKPAVVPRAGIRVGVAVQLIAVLVLYAAANYFSFENYSRTDFSRSQKFSLSTQSRRVLREFKKPVRIIVIVSPTFVSPVTQILGDIRNLLKEVQFSAREGVRIRYVDPTRDLERMRELQAKYKFGNADNLMIIDYDGRTRFVNLAEMADFDLSPIAQGDPPRLLAFRGEQVLTGALIGLIHPGKEVVYFLQGHGEPSVGAGSQIGLFLDSMAKQNIKIQTLSLASSDVIPADASAIVVLSPRFDLEEREAVLLGAWLRSRGRMLVLSDPNFPAPRLNRLVAASGITPRDDRVLRTVKLPFATGILREVTGEILPTTEITRKLQGATILFPGATQSLGLDNALAEKEKILLRPLVQAAEEFWGETDYAPNNPKGVRYEDGRDNGQPLTVAASADRNGVEDDRVEVQTSRLIVFGNSQFAYDASLSPQGLDLLLGSVNYLLDRGKSLSGVTPKTVSHFALNLTDWQLSRIAMLVMLVIPALAGVAGLVVWWRRRR